MLRRLSDPTGTDGNKAYRDALERLKSKTLLPVVECRMTNVVLGKKNTTGQRINFHLIFSPDVSVDDIETFIKGIEVKDQTIGGRYSDSSFLLNDGAADFNAVRQRLGRDNTFKSKFLTQRLIQRCGRAAGLTRLAVPAHFSSVSFLRLVAPSRSYISFGSSTFRASTCTRKRLLTMAFSSPSLPLAFHFSQPGNSPTFTDFS